MTDVKKNSYDKGQNFAVSTGKEECPFRRNGVEGWVEGGRGVAQVGEDASNQQQKKKGQKKEAALVVVSFAGSCGARGKT